MLPTARDDQHPGICYLPDGADMYGILARLHTSMDFSPEELHAMGREIVDEVIEEIMETGARLSGHRRPRDLRATVQRSLLRYESREEMLDHARRVVAAAEAEAPRVVRHRSRRAVCRRPVPEAEEAGMTAAYYMPGAIDGSRPGTYYLNTSQPEERHRYAAEDIAFHEAVPGHHFQLTIAMESRTWPRPGRCSSTRPVRRDGASTANGWPTRWASTATTCARMGLFAADSWRASRLVVDTGPARVGLDPPERRRLDGRAHAAPPPRGGDPRSTATSRTPARRSPTWSAGAKSSDSVPTAADRLGTRFDLREFHDLVLRAGILPLPALARTVERGWTASRIERASCATARTRPRAVAQRGLHQVHPLPRRPAGHVGTRPPSGVRAGRAPTTAIRPA